MTGTLSPRATILIVDDHEANRETLMALLDQEAYQVIEAGDGAAALRLATEHMPDLVLLDVMMPGMDGFEVCRRLRADPRTAEMPVVLVTALDDRPSRVTGIEAGADDFVTKPYDRAELRARVRTIVRLNRFARLQRERARADRADDRVREHAALIDLVPTAILVLDLDGTIRLWNKGAERLYGWTADEAVGRPADHIMRPGSQSPPAVLPAVRANGQWVGELTHRQRDGAEVIVDSRWTMLAAASPRVLVVNSDITDRKRSEERFLRAQRLESLGSLASGIVHDLNNVLAPILMATELLRSDPEEGPQWVDMIEASAQRGSSMVKQILSFSRGTGAGRHPVQLQHLCKDLGRLVKDTFPSDIECHIDLSANLPAITADPTQVYQVLLNLAVNARDAMPSGGVLRITAEPADGDASCGSTGRHVVIHVADTGEGIPPEHLSKIFDPFFTTKAPGIGTGLGLATVRQVVEAHSGRVEVHSVVGRGTRFTVRLPASDDRPAEIAAANEALPTGRGELVLVADDEAAVREITKATLEGFGYRVAVAGSGIEVVAHVASHRDDLALLLTDLQMPQLDGLAAIRASRHLCPRLKAVVVSGSPEHRTLVDDSGLDLNGFLLKPLTAGTLLREMHRVLHAT